MKKVSVKKEILVIVMIVVSILTISTKVLATSDNPVQVQIPTIDTNTEDTNTTNVVDPIANVVTPTTNTTTSTYQNTTLPQTGDASDYAIFMLIVVAIIVAIYAYRKVRNYNI